MITKIVILIEIIIIITTTIIIIIMIIYLISTSGLWASETDMVIACLTPAIPINTPTFILFAILLNTQPSIFFLSLYYHPFGVHLSSKNVYFRFHYCMKTTSILRTTQKMAKGHFKISPSTHIPYHNKEQININT